MDNKYEPQMNYAQMQMMNEVAGKNIEKINEFKKRIEEFEKVSTLDEAKTLAKSIMPVSQEVNRFNIGGAKCIVINKPDMFRITINTPDEFISYDFT